MQKRFEETIAGMQNDIMLKATARQAIIDEIDKDKPQPAPTMEPVAPLATPKAPDPEEGAGDESDDDLFGDDESDEGTETAGSPSQTPVEMPPPDLPRDQIQRVPSKLSMPSFPDTPASDIEMDADGETDDGAEEAGGTDAEGEEEEEDGDEEDDEDAEGEDDGDAEMLAMLMAAGNEDEGGEPSMKADDVPSSESVDDVRGVEGGAGRRRLAEGVASGSEEDSSDDSD